MLVSEDYRIAKEQPYQVRVNGVDSLRKLDLVVINGSGKFAVDVTVRYEDRESLTNAALVKLTTTRPNPPSCGRETPRLLGRCYPLWWVVEGHSLGPRRSP